MMFGSFIHLVASKIPALQIAVLIILKFMHFIKKVEDGQVDLEQIEKEKQHDAKKISEIWSADFASAWTHTFIILPGDESRSPKQLQMGETVPNSEPMKQITAPFLDSCGDNAVDADDSKFMRFIKKVGDGQVVSPFLFVLNQHAKKIPEIWSADFASAWTHLILQSMKTFPLLLGIQMAATACLYNLTKGPLSSKIHTKWLNEIVDLTLISMENFPKQPQLQKNSLLTLCSDRMLQDVSFNRYRCAELVMNSLLAFDDPAMNRMSVAICSILTARITTAETSVLGAKEAYMRRLLNIVKSKSEQRDIDIMMKFTLSALWNLSDESPKTCSVFLNLGGMELFLEVLKEHDDFLHQLTSVEDWLYGEGEEQEAVYKERLDELKVDQILM